MGSIGISIVTGFQVSTCLNIALNREQLTRDFSYHQSERRCASREGAQCKQAVLGPTREQPGRVMRIFLKVHFLKVYFQADPAVDREAKALAMHGP